MSVGSELSAYNYSRLKLKAFSAVGNELTDKIFIVL